MTNADEAHTQEMFVKAKHWCSMALDCNRQRFHMAAAATIAVVPDEAVIDARCPIEPPDDIVDDVTLDALDAASAEGVPPVACAGGDRGGVAGGRARGRGRGCGMGAPAGRGRGRGTGASSSGSDSDSSASESGAGPDSDSSSSSDRSGSGDS